MIQASTKIDQVLKLYRESYPAFCRMLMRDWAGARYIDLSSNPYLCVLWAHLEEFAHNRSEQLYVCLPPKHFRSTLALTLALYLMGRHPNQRIIFVCETQALARAKADLAKSCFDKPKVRAVFPGIARCRSRGNSFSFNAGGSLSFVPWHHNIEAEYADVLIFDEPLSFKEMRDYSKINEIYEHIQNCIVPACEDKRVFLIGSRVWAADLFKFLGVRPEYGWFPRSPWIKSGRVQLIFPLKIHHEINYFFPNGEHVTRPKNELLCEDLVRPQALLSLIRKVGSLVYWSRYMQLPLLESEVRSDFNFPPGNHINEVMTTNVFLFVCSMYFQRMRSWVHGGTFIPP